MLFICTVTSFTHLYIRHPWSGGHQLPLINNASLDYFAAKGMNTVRVPILWERLQPTLYGDFDWTYVIGSRAVPYSALTDVWQKLATLYKSNDEPRNRARMGGIGRHSGEAPPLVQRPMGLSVGC